jgi:hypothetical protein
MITVAEYRNFAAQCREMVVRTDNQLDRKVLQIRAAARERIANEREAVLKRGEIPKP